MLNNIIKFFIDNKLVAWLLLLIFIAWGLVAAPFDYGISWLPRDPVAVDAIPDIGENQQIIFTKWPGRSPQDVEDQITYPLTTSLLGLPGVKSIRSNSMLGFSSIYVIFEEDVEFYWSRSRILEKLNSLSPNLLPDGVQPTLGPDATALGQIYWYTLEGQDSLGNTVGGWDLHELRSIQDFYVRYGLSSVSGVAEVASIGGFVKEYQIDVNPDKMRAYNVTLNQVMKAVKESNLDIGAQTLEINLAEYFVRGLGYVKSIEDIENAVVVVNNNVPIRIKDIAFVNIGPATRRGILDKSGAEAVGGVVIARYGENPMEVISNVKKKSVEIAGGLPSKVLEDGTISQVTIVPFYDRSKLIYETLGTLEEALSLEILITIIVVILLLLNLKSSLLVAGSLPVAVLICFIAMRYFGVDANIVALSGIAIAIGTMVDMGIVLVESMNNQLEEAPPDEAVSTTIYNATKEVAPAIITAVATTIVSFLPVFTMEAAEGKLFRPLAFTKTFALLASILVSITILPPLATQLFSWKAKSKWLPLVYNTVLFVLSIILLFTSFYFIGIMGLAVSIFSLVNHFLKQSSRPELLFYFDIFRNIIYALIISILLASIWMPLGVEKSVFANLIFVAGTIGTLIGSFYLIIHFYERILRFLLKVKFFFLLLIAIILFLGVQIARNTGQEFMPALNEGAFLLMPTSMPHSGMEINQANLRVLDMAVTAIPEVATVVGKAGRIESALDPAPMSMYENMVLYKSEYLLDEDGHRLRYKTDEDGNFVLTTGEALSNQDALIQKINPKLLILDPKGSYYRQWRDHIQSPDDIWDEIVLATNLPGITSAPKLQPIQTRLVMLQTGMRAPMGIKVKGPDLATIEAVGLEIESLLKQVEGVKVQAVFAERIVGKPYLLLDINREQISRYGLTIVEVQNQIQVAVGGMVMTSTVEGRERYGIKIRYPRELRDDPEKLMEIYISTAANGQIKLGDVVDLKYEQGPQAIKSEDGFLIGYVLFDKLDEYSEVDVVTNAQDFLQTQIKNKTFILPKGVSYKFAGTYEQQVRASNKLSIVVPIALLIILLILYFQFRSITLSLIVFSGVFVAFSGGFFMIWFYGQDWFLNFSLFDTNFRDLFQVKVINLSVAVWVGFLALFGIATDDGVLVGTFLQDSFKRNEPTSIKEIRDAVVEGGLRRVKPAMMTTATTLLALLPVLTSTGRGSDIMIPMAIPSFGGMTLQIITMFTVPILFSLWKEMSFKWKQYKNKGEAI
ncbi:MAG: efflux RND transporter permease subunit [Chitinophagales bacterium]|nr:efflux RND transporter permease subunit [Chitinophagales bacterium]